MITLETAIVIAEWVLILCLAGLAYVIWDIWRRR